MSAFPLTQQFFEADIVILSISQIAKSSHGIVSLPKIICLIDGIKLNPQNLVRHHMSCWLVHDEMMAEVYYSISSSFIECFLCARHCSKYIITIISFNVHINPLK